MKLLQHLARQVIRAQAHGATPGPLVDSVAIPVIAGPQTDRRRHPCVEISTPSSLGPPTSTSATPGRRGPRRVEFPLRPMIAVNADGHELTFCAPER